MHPKNTGYYRSRKIVSVGLVHQNRNMEKTCVVRQPTTFYGAHYFSVSPKECRPKHP